MTERREVTGFGKTATSAIAAKMTSHAWAIRKMPFHSIRSRSAASWSDVTRSRAAIRCDATALVADIDRSWFAADAKHRRKRHTRAIYHTRRRIRAPIFYDGIISIIQSRERQDGCSSLEPHIAGTYLPSFNVRIIRERSSRPERSFSVQL